jgi:hypothetical protein
MLMLMAGVIATGRYTDLLNGLSLGPFSFGVMLVALGCGMVLLGVMGRRFGAWLAIGLVLTMAALPVTLVTGYRTALTQDTGVDVGVSTFTPRQAARASDGISLTAGNLYANLTDSNLLADGDLTVEMYVGAGQANLVVPQDVPVTINARVDIGQVSPDGLTSEYWDGRNLELLGSDDHSRYPDGMYFQNAWEDIAGIGARATFDSRVETGPTQPYRLTVNIRVGIGQLDIRAEESTPEER